MKPDITLLTYIGVQMTESISDDTVTFQNSSTAFACASFQVSDKYLGTFD